MVLLIMLHPTQELEPPANPARFSSDPGSAVCPPVVIYDPAVRELAAEELKALPEDAALVGMMADHAVMRAQAMACEAE